MFIAYLIVCSGVWANLQTLGEMTIAFPVSGNYIDYAGRWVDPALAFGAGFAEWLGRSTLRIIERICPILTAIRMDCRVCCRSTVLCGACRLLGKGHSAPCRIKYITIKPNTSKPS
jgi:hypothetical protein